MGETHVLERAFARMADGDHEAMGEVFDITCPGLLVRLAAWVDGQTALEDLIRRTFVEVWRTAPRADLGRGASAWIDTVAQEVAGLRSDGPVAGRAIA